jgi:predicted lipoprotein with Yx(FWY)xxD motif
MRVTTTGEGRDMRDPRERYERRGQNRRARQGWRHSTRLAIAATAGALALAVSLAAIALAASAPTVSSLSSAKLKETIVVSAQGRTLYWLSPETTHHLLCTTSECLKFWPPLTVSSAHATLKAGSGVHGSLGIIHRNGIYQVTLRGEPLYFYYGDHAKGQVNGQGIKSFGGTWYAVTASA